MTDPEFTRQQQAELLVQGIEASGLNVDAELAKLEAMTPAAKALAVQEFQLAALAAGLDKLPGNEGA